MASVFKRGGKTNREGAYYVAWHEWDGGRLRRRTKSTKTTDKATAERIANKYEADAALRREGVIDPALEGISKEAQRTIEAHLTDYKSKLLASDRSAQYVRETIGYVRKIAKFAKFQVAADIEPDAVNRFANSLKDENMSARTIHAYLTAVKGFTKWLSLHHKLPRDPLASVKRPNPDTDRRRERRMMLHDEWDWLEATVPTAETNYGMAASERLLLYETAIQTGLRSNELRSLTRGRLHLTVAQPFITCKAGATKNQRDARQFIQRDLAERLASHIATKLPKAPLFNMPKQTEVAAMLRDDLATARAEWLKEAKGDPQEYSRREESDFLLPTNHDSETLDFHALRHTCGAWLAKLGVHPKVVQTVMRHCSITLTMDRYGHLFPGEEAEAINRFGRVMGQRPQLMAATGTNDASADRRSAERSRRDADQCSPSVLGATASLISEDTRPSTITEETAATSTSMQFDAMPCSLIPPMAQLAEQLII